MSIERIPQRARHQHPELVTELAGALDPSRENDTGPGVPRIREIEQSYGNALRVEVTWDSWEGVPHTERGPIILDAYLQTRGEQEMLRITSALGITPDEAARLNIQAGGEEHDEVSN